MLKRVMACAVRNIHLSFAAFFIILTVINYTVIAAGYKYVPVSYMANYIIIGSLFIAYGIISCVFARTQTADSKKAGMISVVWLLLYFISVVSVTETNQMYVNNSLFPFCVLFCVMYIVWVIIFSVCTKNKVCISIVYVFALLLSILMAYVLLAAFIFGGFGAAELIGERKYSPDGKNCAWVELYDEGALGGSEVVYIRNVSEDIPLGIGRLKTRDKRAGSYSHYDPEHYIIEWQDNDTLLINGKAYKR